MQSKSKTKNQKSKTENGYVTLVSMLVIGAVGLSVVTSLVLLGAGSTQNSFALEQGDQARALAGACAEEALQQIWDWDTYVGSGNLALGQGNCSYVVSGDIVPKTVMAQGIVGGAVRRVSIVVDQLHPYVHVSSWRETAE